MSSASTGGDKEAQAAGGLGWVAVEGFDGQERCFYVRQLWDGKGSMDLEQMSVRDLDIYASLCGEVLARGHARSGNRFAIASYPGSGEVFDKAMARFAESYADQNERAFERVTEAAASGGLRVEAEV